MNRKWIESKDFQRHGKFIKTLKISFMVANKLTLEKKRFRRSFKIKAHMFWCSFSMWASYGWGVGNPTISRETRAHSHINITNNGAQEFWFTLRLQLPKINIFQKWPGLDYDILACWRRARTKSGKYGPRVLWSQFYMSLGSLYVPREVDLADKTRGAQTYRLPLFSFLCFFLDFLSWIVRSEDSC